MQRWEDNIEVDLKGIGQKDADFIHLVQDRFHWRAVMNTAMNFHFPRGWDFLTS
jgi:hypothetical protein